MTKQKRQQDPSGERIPSSKDCGPTVTDYPGLDDSQGKSGKIRSHDEDDDRNSRMTAGPSPGERR